MFILIGMNTEGDFPMLDTRHVLADNLRVLESISIGGDAAKMVHQHELALLLRPSAKQGFAKNFKHPVKPAPFRGAAMRRRL